MLCRSFAPVVQDNAHTLVLGSMPGIASLDAQQYYAHPRNGFWPIIADTYEQTLPSVYIERLQWLKALGLAMWDVLKYCDREGSLDADIHIASEQANDLVTLVDQLPCLHRICFNGKKAFAAYKKHILPQCDLSAKVEIAVLPSTSPAYASMSYQEKLIHWRKALLCG